MKPELLVSGPSPPIASQTPTRQSSKPLTSPRFAASLPLTDRVVKLHFGGQTPNGKILPDATDSKLLKFEEAFKKLYTDHYKEMLDHGWLNAFDGGEDFSKNPQVLDVDAFVFGMLRYYLQGSRPDRVFKTPSGEIGVGGGILQRLDDFLGVTNQAHRAENHLRDFDRDAFDQLSDEIRLFLPERMKVYPFSRSGRDGTLDLRRIGLILRTQSEQWEKELIKASGRTPKVFAGRVSGQHEPVTAPTAASQPSQAGEAPRQEEWTTWQKFKNYFFSPKTWGWFQNPLVAAILGALVGVFPFPLLMAATIPLALLIGALFHKPKEPAPQETRQETPQQPTNQEGHTEAGGSWLDRIFNYLTKEEDLPGGTAPGSVTLSLSLQRLLTEFIRRQEVAYKTEPTLSDFFALLFECEKMRDCPEDIQRTVAKIKAIRQQVGEIDQKYPLASDPLPASVPYYKGLLEAQKDDIPSERYKRIGEEIRRLEQTDGHLSNEAEVLRKKLDHIFDLPTKAKTLPPCDAARAREILDSEHYNLNQVKSRIIKHLAREEGVEPAKKKSKIICLVGPRGIGKTTIGESIARATDRELVRINLDGIDSAREILGHGQTYIGSKPGRIIEGLTRVSSINPLILLDEIDKMGRGVVHGDPAYALSALLDPERNKDFRDDYLGFGVDLSQAMFVCTANSLEEIPPALFDRLEIINLHSYIPQEQFQIAKRHVVRRTREQVGLSLENMNRPKNDWLDKTAWKKWPKDQEPFTLPDKVLNHIVHEYAIGGSVRGLERTINRLGDNLKASILETLKTRKLKPQDFDVLKSVASLKKAGYLGEPPYPLEKVEPHPQPGYVNGMYASSGERSGGTIPISVKVIKLPKTPERVSGIVEIQVRGGLGDVMKESVDTARSFIEAEWDTLAPLIAKEYKDTPLRLNILFEGLSTPKDGPSATAATTLAILSALTKQPVPGTFAMTGEMNDRGKMMIIGGVREKITGSAVQGVKDFLIPEENERHLKDDPQETWEGIPDTFFKEKGRYNIQVTPVRHFADVMAHVWPDLKKRKDKLLDKIRSAVSMSPQLAPALTFSGYHSLASSGPNPFSQVAALK